MSDSHLFIYGFLKETDAPAPVELTGLDHQPVERICAGGIAAIVSRLALQNFAALEASTRLTYLADYQRVNETLMGLADIIPAKFGAMLPQGDILEKALRQHATIIRSQLEHFAGQVEINVTAIWQQFQQVLAQIGDTEAIRMLKQQAQTHPDQLQAIQLQVGKQIKETIDRMNAEMATHVTDHLAGLADAWHANPVMDDTMILNAAFLIPRTAQAPFEAGLDSLDQRHGQNVLFRLIGPLPLYSFGSLIIETPDPEVIDQARRVLELPTRASKTDIRDAFRRLSQIWHPDRHAADPEAQQRFESIAAAWQLLDRYCTGTPCSFEPHAVRQQVHIVPKDSNQAEGGQTPSISL